MPRRPSAPCTEHLVPYCTNPVCKLEEQYGSNPRIEHHQEDDRYLPSPDPVIPTVNSREEFL